MHTAQMEADQLKTNLRNQQTLLAGKAHDQAQEETTAALPATGVDGVRRASIPRLAAATSHGDRSKQSCLTSRRPSESTADAGDIPNPLNSVTPNSCDGPKKEEEEEEEEEQKKEADDAVTATAHVQHGEATRSPSEAARLDEVEDRVASAEKALAAARNSSRAALERAKLLEQDLGHARAAAGAEAEGKRLAHARIAELERDVHLMGVEQEAIRVRAETRLESLRAAFEQEELEAGGKVTRRADRHFGREYFGFVLCNGGGMTCEDRVARPLGTVLVGCEQANSSGSVAVSGEALQLFRMR